MYNMCLPFINKNEIGSGILFRIRDKNSVMYYFYRSVRYGDWIIGYENNEIVYVSEPIV